jgi:8-oxo-dGTP diphosphatase
MQKVLMLHRNKEPYKHMLNGVGGKIEEGETPYNGALRELEEETSIVLEDLNVMDKLLSSQYPGDVELHIYYGRLRESVQTPVPKHSEEGVIDWASTEELIDVRRRDIAGEGNVAYFINLAKLIEENKQ